MREIKFRAWDSKYKLMRLDTTYAMAFDGTVKLLSKYEDNESGEYHSCGNGIIPMRYTGLLDKNGKEIYEGDIIRCFLGESMIVKFGQYDGGGGDSDRDVGNGFYLEHVHPENQMFKLSSMDPFIHGHRHTEVVGNVYENPELVK